MSYGDEECTNLTQVFQKTRIMKKKVLTWAIFLSAVLNVSAQKTTNAEELKRFYTEYLSNLVSNNTKTDSLVKAYCTKELYAAWNEIVNEIGLYDPFTNGFCDDLDFMKNTLVVKKENDGYVVSFNYLTWPDNKTMCESVIVYVNSDGKISHTKRPSDVYMIPEE